MNNTASIFLCILALFVYFVPTMTALARRHVNALPIFLTNLLLGVTVIGWVVALIWSFTHQADTDAAPAAKSRAARFLLKFTLFLAVLFALMTLWVKGQRPVGVKDAVVPSETKIRTGVPVPADELFGK